MKRGGLCSKGVGVLLAGSLLLLAGHGGAQAEDAFTHQGPKGWIACTGHQMAVAEQGEAVIITAEAATPYRFLGLAGVYLEIPPAVSQKLAGHKIKVMVYARKPPQNGSNLADWGYWTGKAGKGQHSGWRSAMLGDTYSPYGFFFSVPSGSHSRKHYLCVLGHAKGKGRSVMVKKVTIEIVK